MIIKGNTVGTPMPRPNWNQTDPKKADYIINKPVYLEQAFEATVSTGGINQIQMDEDTFKNIVTEGVNRITLILSDDVIFKGESWYFGTYYKSLYYFNGTAWVDVQTLSDVGYSKGQSMQLECKVDAQGNIEYVHIINLPSGVPLTVESIKSYIDEALGVVENGSY